MTTKKLCSLGRLNININLVLRKTEAQKLNFDINHYNKIEDLKDIFSFNYMDFITLTSDNYLINTLLYINRASKNKSFIEFIMPNQLEYDYSKKFIKKLIENVLAKNYFFIIENKFTNSASKIKFIIKIIDEDNNEVISYKNFELFEKNEMDFKLEDNNDEKAQNLFLNKINYNFKKTDYFIIDLKEIKKLLIDYDSIYNFLFKIVNNYSSLTIILIIDDNINEQNKDELFIIKQLIELCDIIFSFKNNMNYFLKSFYSLKKRDIWEIEPSKIYFLPKNKENLNDLDLITKDFDKYRQNVPRISVIFDEFNLIYIYKQHFSKKSLSYEKIFPLLMNEINFTDNIKEFIYTNSNKLYHIFIGGFLSRYIYNKPFDICLKAGKLLMKKTINIFISQKDYFTNQEKYNVEVNSKKINLMQRVKKIILKEKNFILDCTNEAKSQKKEYNVLSDNNCLGFLTKKYYSKPKKKTPSLMDKINTLLRKPKNKYCSILQSNAYSPINNNNLDRINKNNLYTKNKIKRLLPFISTNDIKKYTSFNQEKNLYDMKFNINKNSKTISSFVNSKNKKYKIVNNYKSYLNVNGNSLVENALNNINEAEDYNKYLFKMYQPQKNFEDFLNDYNSLRNIKFQK